MSEILIHKSSDYIEEDRDYYYSDTRDKHGMIQPSHDMVSVSCDSNIFKPNPTNDEICSIYYPFEKKSFHRIYLGISFPLFANNWGAAFLRHLMYLIKPDGSVILPVYAERQGVEKNYWSRSSLEVIFQSRQKWWGMSNIWAENDGVMSMRIGKKEPPMKNSTFHFFLENEIKKIDSNNCNSELSKKIKRHHDNGINSAIIEQIIINYFGRTKPLSFCDLSIDGLLASEILMSDYVNIKDSAISFDQDHEEIHDYKNYLMDGFKKRLSVLSQQKSHDIITIIDVTDKNYISNKKEIIKNAFANLNKNGVLVIRDISFNDNEFMSEVNNMLPTTSKHSQYSSLVATKHNSKIDIPHYSDIIFDELKNENNHRKNVFNIFQKI